MCGHHRRRLGRLGWPGAVDPPAGGWAAGSPAPRAGNAVEVLIDGAEALPRIATELERARSHVHIAGWYFSPDFALAREGAPSVVRNLLGDLAERVEVRVLVWAGAPLPLFRPSRKTVREMRNRLIAGTKIQCGLDAHERPMHCHHEKTIVIDDRVAFVGGIDLTSEAATATTRAITTHGRHSAGTTPVPASKGQPSWTLPSISACAGTKSQARSCRHPPPGAGRPYRAPDRPDSPRADLQGCPEWGLPDPRVLPAGLLKAAEVHLPGEPVSLVTGDRDALRDKLDQPTHPRLPTRLVLLPAKPNNGADARAACRRAR